MLNLYNPKDWYWIVDNDATRLWSSRRAQFVAAGDLDLSAFCAAGKKPTAIRNEVELQDVLLRAYPAGAMTRDFDVDEVLAALLIIDQAAVCAAFGVANESEITPDASILCALLKEFGMAAISVK